MSVLPQRIAVTGASGLIGSALVGHLKSEGHTVQRLVRRLPVSPDEVQGDPSTGYVDTAALAGVDAVIHLAGVGVGDKRWSKKYKSQILNSRLLGTEAIAKADAIPVMPGEWGVDIGRPGGDHDPRQIQRHHLEVRTKASLGQAKRVGQTRRALANNLNSRFRL
jgi:hypothetical protein